MLEELAELTGAEPVVVGPVEGVELAAPVDGLLPLVELAGAADGAGAALAESVDELIEDPEAAVEG